MVYYNYLIIITLFYTISDIFCDTLEYNNNNITRYDVTTVITIIVILYR